MVAATFGRQPDRLADGRIVEEPDGPQAETIADRMTGMCA
jgi:hypothetical protein